MFINRNSETNKPPMFELKHLKTLDSLARTHSLAKTARELYMTDSALSHQVKELEKRLGGPLFERKTSPIHFTSKGRLLLDLAEQVLPLIKQTQYILLNQGLAQLRVSVECHACFSWLLPAIRVFKQHQPDFAIDFTSETIYSSAQALRQRQADVVFTSDKQADDAIAYTTIGDFESVLVCSTNHPLTQKAHISAQDIAQQTILTYPVEPARLDLFKLFLYPAGVTPKHIRTVEQANVLVQMVSADMGIAGLPLWAVKEYQRQGLVTTRRLGSKGIHRQLFAAYRIEDQNDTNLKAFLTLSQQQFGLL